MQTNWRMVVLIVGAFYFGDFLTVGFKDYSVLVNQNKQTAGQLSEIRSQLAQSGVTCQLQTNEITNQRDAEKAKNQTMEKQNRDQQSTINGCLTQAMKLLTPEPFKMTLLALDPDRPVPPGTKAVRWLLLSNKTVTPAVIDFTCDVTIEEASIMPIGSALMGGTSKLATNLWRTVIQSPAWSPGLPLLATIIHRDAKNNIVCSFNSH